MRSLCIPRARGRFRPCREWAEMRIVGYTPSDPTREAVCIERIRYSEKPDGNIVIQQADGFNRKGVAVQPHQMRVDCRIGIAGQVKPRRIPGLLALFIRRAKEIDPRCKPYINGQTVMLKTHVSSANRLKERLKESNVTWE